MTALRGGAATPRRMRDGTPTLSPCEAVSPTAIYILSCCPLKAGDAHERVLALRFIADTSVLLEPMMQCVTLTTVLETGIDDNTVFSGCIIFP